MNLQLVRHSESVYSGFVPQNQIVFYKYWFIEHNSDKQKSQDILALRS